MPLEDYGGKRDFDKTPEPGLGGKTDKTGKKLTFVVHKHFASHLHFDLRLELDGVLKSWAIPKGPTMNPKEKKLAVMVEDHPLEYRDFEGVIPDGNYGAGQVYIWDSGTYHAPGFYDREKSSEVLRDGLSRGHLTFILEGNYLKGEFALVRLKKATPKGWLLIKKNDEFSGSMDIAEVKAPAEAKKKLI
jgi:bifunctional non-homologous end joining protein LigD